MIPQCSLKYKLYLRELSMCAHVHHALHLSWVHGLCLTVATLSPHKVREDKGKTPVSMSERSTMESSPLRARIQGPHSIQELQLLSLESAEQRRSLDKKQSQRKESQGPVHTMQTANVLGGTVGVVG